MGKITDPTQPYFGQGLWTWDGSQWRRQSLLFGYSSLAGEQLSDSDLDAGSNTVDGTAVASGVIMVVNQLAIRYDGTPPTSMYVKTSGCPGNPILLVKYSITSTRWYCERCNVVLAAGDFVQLGISGATVHDAAYFYYSGFNVNIQE